MDKILPRVQTIHNPCLYRRRFHAWRGTPGPAET